ncbi:hypothetical protein F5148DRAFT_1178040 [Russula earlei]|uniref:Uncharacterized protein n=1 Tax=Russula earlei TaxID=71964 RepID=A0ACC0UGC5_9AGAM|nr:hypothetical protein F5148DRAFT_1178040 [Russula earlei]
MPFPPDPLDRIAEFNAIMTASFDDIGSHVALDNIHPLRPTTTRPVPFSSSSSSEKGATRLFPLSFLRKVKSHAASLLVSQTTPGLSISPPRSFVPSLPIAPSHPPTSPPFSSSLSRKFLSRAFGKHAHAPDLPDLGPNRSFFDDDDDDDDHGGIDPRVYPPTRRVVSVPTRSNLRRSSVFAAAPTIFSLSSHSVSTPYLVPEKPEVVGPASRADLAHQTSKLSLRLRLRTKLSLPKLASPRSHHSSPSSEPSPVTPFYPSHPHSATFTDFEHTHASCTSLGDRSITPDEDPFRKDEVAPHLFASCRLPNSFLRSGSHDSGSEMDHQNPNSLPVLSSRWSSDSESPPSSPNHSLISRRRSGRVPSPNQSAPRVSSSPLQGPSRSPLSFTFPPLSSIQKSMPYPGVTVQATTPAPGPPPQYPPPRSPPPSGPLPCPPPADTNITSGAQPLTVLQKSVSKMHPRKDFGKSIPKSTPTSKAQHWLSYLEINKPSISFSPRNMPLRSPLEGPSDAANRTEQKSPRRRRRPVTPYPLLPYVGRLEQKTTARLEASKAVAPYTGSCDFDQNTDGVPDSEVEPDRKFQVDTDKPRKKMSFSSATSAQTTESNISTTSLVSVVTTMTVATTPSSKHAAPPSDSNAQSSGIYALSDMFLVRGEQVIISAPRWTEFCDHCDTCRDVTLCLAGGPHDNGVVDVLIVEIQRAGKVYGVELRIIAGTSMPQTSADVPGRIPGSYPASSESPSLLPVIPHIPTTNLPQNACIKSRGSALGLEGVPQLDAGCITHSSPSCSAPRFGSHLDRANEGGTQHRALLAFTIRLPTTLRDLAKRAEEMSLLDGIAMP